MNDNGSINSPQDGEKRPTAQGWVKEFDKCPNCSSTDRFFGGIVKELKEKGLVRQEWNFFLDSKSGVVADPSKEASVPLGAEMPAYGFATDICSNCGTIYVVKLEKTTAKKQLAPRPLVLPDPLNRADRRREMKFNPGMNNPLLS